VSAAKQEIGARVDALAQTLEGDEFVAEIERLAAEMSPDDRVALQEVLLERAAEEEELQQAVRRRFAEKGWTRRTLARIEGLWRDDRADAIASAIQAAPDGETALSNELEALRRDRGRAAIVLDELSRHGDARVRAWVAVTASDVLGDGGSRLILSLTRDREPEVCDAAVSALLALGSNASRLVLPDLRRRLHSSSAAERIAAMQALAAAGDATALAVIDERAAEAHSTEERQAASAAALTIRARSS
jgi:hypothetical protein